MAKTKFPKTFYVVREEDGENTYFMLYENPRECVDVTQDREAAVYELKYVGELKTTVELA